MKVYTCTMYSGETLNDFVLGVFSTHEKAEKQAKTWMDGIGQMYEEVDRTNDPSQTTIYYQTIGDCTNYSALIEEFTLDEMSY